MIVMIFDLLRQMYTISIGITETTTGITFVTTVTTESDGGKSDPCGINQPKVIDATNPGVLISPDHPNYPNNAECSWLIEAGSQEAIRLSIIEFHLEE